MFKTDVHLVSFILNGIAVPLPIFHGHLRHGVGGGDGPLLLLNEFREIPILPLPDTVLNVLSFWPYFTHIAHALSQLCRYPVVSAPQGYWGPVPVLERLPLPLLDGGNIPLYTLFCLPGRHFINSRTFRKVWPCPCRSIPNHWRMNEWMNELILHCGIVPPLKNVFRTTFRHSLDDSPASYLT